MSKNHSSFILLEKEVNFVFQIFFKFFRWVYFSEDFALSVKYSFIVPFMKCSGNHFVFMRWWIQYISSSSNHFDNMNRSARKRGNSLVIEEICFYLGWKGYPVQYPVSDRIRPFFSYPVSDRIPDIRIPDIRLDIRQTEY